MKKLEFKSEEFWMLHQDSAATYAQTKFDEWFKTNIESAPVVYGPSSHWQNWNTEKGHKDTHTARLIDIQEIKKECVKHEPEVNAFNMFRCKHCKVELIAEFKEKK